MSNTVPILSIVFMAISGIAGFAIPVVLFFYYRRRRGAHIVPFFIGCAVMMIFALTIESLIHQIVLNMTSAGKVIKGNIWLYALYGGAMAALFEETGRFIAMKTVLKRWRGNDVNALMYGAGHGGLEAAVILGVSMISNIVIAVMINTGTAGLITDKLTGDAAQQIKAAFDTLITTQPHMFLVGIAERLFAVTLQIALSVLVWVAVKKKGKWFLFPVALLIHFTVDAATVVIASKSVAASEAAVFAMSVATALLSYFIWKKNGLRAERDKESAESITIAENEDFLQEGEE